MATGRDGRGGPGATTDRRQVPAALARSEQPVFSCLVVSSRSCTGEGSRRPSYSSGRNGVRPRLVISARADRRGEGRQVGGRSAGGYSFRSRRRYWIASPIQHRERAGEPRASPGAAEALGRALGHVSVVDSGFLARELGLLLEPVRLGGKAHPDVEAVGSPASGVTMAYWASEMRRSTADLTLVAQREGSGTSGRDGSHIGSPPGPRWLRRDRAWPGDLTASSPSNLFGNCPGRKSLDYNTSSGSFPTPRHIGVVDY